MPGFFVYKKNALESCADGRQTLNEDTKREWPLIEPLFNDLAGFTHTGFSRRAVTCFADREGEILAMKTTLPEGWTLDTAPPAPQCFP